MARFGTGLARRLAFGVSSSRSASCAGQPLLASSPAAQALGGALSVGLGEFFVAPTLVQTRGFAVPKRKVSRSKKGMKENHPSKRIRSKKTYSYCEKCDEVLGPHQICSGILNGTCTCSSLLKPAHGAAGN
ncbi:ribosomal protein L32 [Chloropicon roscoffensis]|uniref:Ribosomal protein L32 n=1 Tax=Chloropicon roscoffensis TaxID=1461544 RepID=A0AAX4P9Z8_9CHLO